MDFTIRRQYQNHESVQPLILKGPWEYLAFLKRFWYGDEVVFTYVKHS